jgi:hypothetical protein
MNRSDFYNILAGVRLPFLLPGKDRAGELPSNFIARYNQSVHHLNTLADEVKHTMGVHTKLEKEREDYNNGEKK